MQEVLNVTNLEVAFAAGTGQVRAVRGVSFSLDQGEVLALVGESGCGKSVTAQAILGLNPAPPACRTSGSVMLCGQEVVGAPERTLRALRGQSAAMVFQDPMTSFNPSMRLGRQITETLLRRRGLPRAQCAGEARRLLELVQIPEPALRARQYPHEFSGGMRQRAMIAMALAAGPRLLICDEPTTALDVTIQLQILQLLQRLQGETGCALLLITHDLSVVAALAQRVAVMYAGQIVEVGPVEALFSRPAHPYTRGLLESLPAPGETGSLASIPGTPPDLYDPPPGCAFAPRCRHCMRVCRTEAPPVFSAGEGRQAACWRLHSDCPKGGDL